MTDDELQYELAWLDIERDKDPENALKQARAKLARGDFPTVSGRYKVKQWIEAEEKRQEEAFGRTMEGAAVRQAAAAERSAAAAEKSALASVIAIGVSLVALMVSVLALMWPPGQQPQPEPPIPAQAKPASSSR